MRSADIECRRSPVGLTMVIGLAVCLATLPEGANAQEAADVFDQFFRYTGKEHKPLFGGTPGESVDPFTGTLRIIQEDLALPGVAGHDLHVMRVYQSKLWGRTDLLTPDVSPLLAENEHSVLGYGWTFHFGRLRNPNASGTSGFCSGDFPVFESPDGSNQVFYPVDGTPDVWLSKEFWRLERHCSAMGGTGTCVWTTAGVRYEFDATLQSFYGTTPMWPAVRIVDPHGNPIVIHYIPFSAFTPQMVNVVHAPVESVTDTYGRTIHFSYKYDVDGARLQTMEANGKIYQYTYTSYSPAQTSGGTGAGARFALMGNRRFLTGFNPPVGPGYTYTYAYNLPVTQNQYALSSITYPAGAQTLYTYRSIDFFTGFTVVPMAVVETKSVSGRELTTGPWLYEYQVPTPGSLSAVDPATGQPTDLNITTITRPDGRKDTFSLIGFAKVANSSTTNDTHTFMVGLPFEAARGDRTEIVVTNWDRLPAISSAVYAAPSYAGCAAIPYPQLADYGVFPVALTQRVIYRDPIGSDFATDSFETDQSDFDAYGQPRTVVEIGTQAGSVTRIIDGYASVLPLHFAGDQTRTTTWTYFSSVADPRQTTSVSSYVVRGLPASQIVQVGAETVANRWTYNGHGHAMDSQTLAGVTTTFGYHSSSGEGIGNLRTVTNALGQTLSLSGYGAGYGWGIPTVLDYNGAFTVRRTAYWEGLVASETDGRGAGFTTSYTYDDIGRPLTVTPPGPAGKNDGVAYQWASDDSSVLLTRGSFSKTSTFDGFGREIRSVDSAGVKTSVHYDAMGLETFRSYPYDAIEKGELFVYDGIGRLTTRRKGVRPAVNNWYCDDLSGCEVTYSYAVNCVTSTEERGRARVSVVTSRCGASFGDPGEQRLAAVLDPNGELWEYDYDITGKLKSAVAPQAAGNRSFDYDPVTHFLTSATSGEAGSTSLVPNAIGQVRYRTDARGVMATYGYEDPLSRLKTLTYQGSGPAGDDVTMDYDLANNVHSRASTNGGTFVEDHDELNRVKSHTWTTPAAWSGTPRQFVTSYEFDHAGCPRTVTYPTGTVITQTCDTLNRITSVAIGGSIAVSNVTYHPSGQVAAMTYGDGSSTTTGITYDDRARATKISAGNVLNIQYGYDGIDNVVSLCRDDGSGVCLSTQPYSDDMCVTEPVSPNRGFCYDKASRLMVALAKDQWGTLVYDYDALGNRTFKAGAISTAFIYDGHNRLDSTSGPEEFPTLTFTWDLAGRLASSSDGASYSYDARGRRVRKTSSGQSVLYHYDAAGRVLAETLPDGTKLRDYIYLGNKLIAVDGCMEGVSSSGCAERQWYHTDTLGSVLARTDSSGTVVAQFDYQPWGEQLQVTGVQGDRQYNGRVYDSGTGFHDYGARMYWPEIGRFVSADTYAGDIRNPASLNRYSYVLDNPYKYVDPTGRETQLAVGLNTANNVFGHVSIIINGQVYSFGTNYTGGSRRVQDWGADAGAFLNAQADARQTQLMTLNIDSSKEAELKGYLDANNPNAEGAPGYALFSNSCVTVTENALVATGVMPTQIKLPNAQNEPPPGSKWAKSTTPGDVGTKAKQAGIVKETATVGMSGGATAKSVSGTVRAASDRWSP